MQPMGNLGGKILVSVVGGKKIGAFVELDDAEKAIREYMKKNNVYPTVWQISDHGNANVYEMDKGAMEEAKSRSDLKVGDMVQGIMGVDGGKEGKIEKIGAPFSSSGSATVWVVGEDGQKWDTYDFNLKKVEKLGQPRFANEDVQKEAKEYRWLANELDEKYHPLISEVSKKLGYDVILVPKFCVALLENVNAHPEAKAVNNALLMSMEESKNLGSKKKMNEASNQKEVNSVARKVAELMLVDHIASELEEKGQFKQVRGKLDQTIPRFVNANYPSGNWDALVGEAMVELSELTVAPEKLIEGVKKFGEDEIAWELFNQISGHGGSHGEDAADFVEQNFDFYMPDAGRNVAMKIVDAIYPDQAE
jgi:hypothetical protein